MNSNYINKIKKIKKEKRKEEYYQKERWNGRKIKRGNFSIC